MNGAFLNAIGILIGGLFGLSLRRPLPLRAQLFFRATLGILTVFFGLRLAYESLAGNFLSALEKIAIAFFALMLGNLAGKLLRLQKISNHFGRFAGNLIAVTQKNPGHGFAAGFQACVILFCAAPLGILGAVTDGLAGYFYLLLVKAVMDGLAMMGFVKMFGWPATLSAFPVFVFFGGIALACQVYARPFLDSHHLTDSVNLTAGLIACAVALVIFEMRKVELANLLPGLIMAPLLAWLLG